MKIAGNFFLVGLMGAGKTTVGRALAHNLNKDFYDADQALEKHTGVNVQTIFDIEGEAGFRRRETETLRRLTQLDNIVLATGGGVVLKAENRELLHKHGMVIYLHAKTEDLWERTRYDKVRPLLQTGDRLAKLAQLYTIRHPLYAELADLTVDTSQQSLHHLALFLEQQIISLYQTC